MVDKEPKKSNNTSERKKTVVIIVQSERHHFSPWFLRLTRTQCVCRAQTYTKHCVRINQLQMCKVRLKFVNVSALPHSFFCFYIEIYQSSVVLNVLNHALCKMTCFVGHQFLSRIRVNVLFIFGCGRPFRQIIDRDSRQPKFIFAVCGRHLIQKWTCETHLWSIQKIMSILIWANDGNSCESKICWIFIARILTEELRCFIRNNALEIVNTTTMTTPIEYIISDGTQRLFHAHLENQFAWNRSRLDSSPDHEKIEKTKRSKTKLSETV